jgi:uncharacterized protein YbjT (DUF2867 family)
MKINAIVTGATGMVGEGVLHECLRHPDVESVLVIGRRPCGVSHPRLKEIVHSDFYNITSIQDQLAGYNACFFCLGVSSIGMNEEKYSKLTFDLSTHVAGVLLKQNPDLVFCYVSGSGTDSTEKGRTMWARVKGRTENTLLNMGFKKAFMFRPGFMKPTPGLKNVLKFYGAVLWMYPLLRGLFPGFVSTLSELGLAMINSVRKGYPKQVLEVRDIVSLAKD